MEDLIKQFQEQSQHLRVEPQNQSWDRVRSRVQIERGKQRLVSSRLFSIAAVVLCLVAMSSGILLYAQWQEAESRVKYSQTIIDLGPSDTNGGIYDIDNIRKYYRLFDIRSDVN